MIDAMKQALEALEDCLEALRRAEAFGEIKVAYEAIAALRQAIAEAEKPPIYVERATTNYEDGWEEGFKAGAQKEKGSTPSNVDPRVLLNSNVNHNKINENRLCDIERRLAKIETQPTKESTLQEISDIGQEIEQEPLCWLKETTTFGGGYEQTGWGDNSGFPVFTAPPRPQNELDIAERAYFAGKQAGIAESEAIKRLWVGLSEEERRYFASWLDFKTDDEVFNAIEAKLKERNT